MMNLKGKTAYFFLIPKTGKSRSGFYGGKILRVESGRAGIIKTLTVRMADGTKRKITRRELTMENITTTGIQWRGRVRSLAEIESKMKGVES